MRSEVLLLGYGAVCLCMMVFNVVYYFTLKNRDRRMEKKNGRLGARVEGQLERLRRGREVEYRHLSYLRRTLSRINNLIVFDRMMAQQRGEESGEFSPELKEYYRVIQPVILYLAMVYREREDMQAAYFAWFLAKHKLNRHMELDSVQEILVEYMNQESLYCRVNAFQALCCLGSPRCVSRAVAALDRNQKFFHNKLLTDSLLAFTGSHKQLTALLLEQFGYYSDQTKLAVLNYIRFRSGDYCEWMLGIMNDPEEDKELRLSAIRYFGRYVYEPARPVLLAFAKDRRALNWEYVAVSATALAAYPGEDATDALVGAIYSSNWYVRSNAAASLTARGLEYDDLVSVVGGSDRYVREMLLYQLEFKRGKEERSGIAV